MSEYSSTELTHLQSAPGAQADLGERYSRVMMNAFGAPQRVFVRGEGIHVWDADGNRYQDMLSGLAVTALGHAHPAVLQAITSQLMTLGHVSNFFATPAQVALAEKLVGTVLGAEPGSARVFFTNSGTEANEAAWKLTRLTGRTRIIAMEGSFHGRTAAALALTWNEKYRAPFEPLPGEVTFVPYGDIDALSAALDDTVAAVIVEPIQGENGVVNPPEGYLQAVRRATRAHGALLWFDEVQTGMGRTGRWLAGGDVDADLVTLAKGLGNGFPIGAVLARGEAANLLQPGQHGTTFGGNPVAAIAGLAVIAVIERDGLLQNTLDLGDLLAERLAALPHVTHVSGAGLLRGVNLDGDFAAAVNAELLQRGFISNAPRPHVLRVAPPLVITEAQALGFVEALGEVLSDPRWDDGDGSS
ncbi:acetylornithine transaminase [Propionibacteriaceae bacterium Y1923]|uniref:acetylornithine transaminase n=1 Tax=Aestuariimicrobium sp. Y1814 TaxID=3418742 RepID=UPI003C182635